MNGLAMPANRCGRMLPIVRHLSQLIVMAVRSSHLLSDAASNGEGNQEARAADRSRGVLITAGVDGR